jgi:cardiolipin synthase
MTELRGDLLFALYMTVAVLTAAHALLYKRDPRSAWAWITACWLFPLGGSLLYMWFGVNRVERRARREVGAAKASEPEAESLPHVPGLPVEVRELVRIGRSMAGRPLLAGNTVKPLHNGEEAYPAMLAAIARAHSRVWLESYIFEDGEVARRFAEALEAAKKRGAQVRVLLDGVGQLSWHAAGRRLLEERGLSVRTFLPLRLWPPLVHANLRDHRKVLVVDDTIAFAGGMNISDAHCVAGGGDVIADLHFRFEGPVARQFAEIFSEHWRFSGREKLALPEPVHGGGPAHCRVITDGPNDDVDRLQLVLLAAIANAHRRVSIMTPYFIPTPELSGALLAAALRGVRITIVLPQRSDQWWVDAATRRWLAQLDPRVEVRYRPAPFAHSKLFLMDDYYALVGSANLDPRSLRLNFELMVEVYDTAFVGGMQRHFDAVCGHSHPVTPAALRRQPLAARLRDAVLWLFSPYL